MTRIGLFQRDLVVHESVYEVYRRTREVAEDAFVELTLEDGTEVFLDPDSIMFFEDAAWPPPARPAF